MAWDYGAGHYFGFLIRCCLVLNIFLFPVSTSKLRANNKTIGEVRRIAFHASPILLCPLHCANTIGPVILTPLKGEAW
jgi:hypothetical protein